MLVDSGTVAAVASVGVPAQEPAPPPGRGAEFGKASPVALVVILLLALATVVLIRSMTRRIRRLPASFDAREVDAQEVDVQRDAGDGAGSAPAERGVEDAGGGRS